MWLLVTPVLLLAVGGCAFQCSTAPLSHQDTEYFVCDNDDYPLADSEYTNDCDYVSTLPLSLCAGPGSQSPASLCWKVLDPASGTLQVTFPLQPLRCNFTGYDLTLMVHEAPVCPAATDEFSKHSKREVKIRNCLEPSCRSQCKQKGVVEFRHVFTACYQLYVTPKRHMQAYQELDSTPMVVTTRYVKTPISTAHNPIVHLDWNSASLTMQAQFRLTPARSEFSFYHVLDSSMGQYSCRKTGVGLASCYTCVGSPEIQCVSEGDKAVSPICSYQGESVVKCRFSGLKPGNYCVRIQFEDDRCVLDSVWGESNNYSSCTWEVFQQFLSAEQRAVEVIGDPHAPTINPILLIFLAFAIIACVVTAVVVYQHLVPNTPAFLPIPNKKLKVAEPPVVLLLYARDCAPFMQAVAQLRLILRHNYNCQVVDCWEDSQFGAVAQNPARWLMSNLSSPRVRCVLVTSPASVAQEAALVRSATVRYLQPRAFDSVITHALATLHETNSHDSYNRLFVVRLDTGEEGLFPKKRTYLNPLTTYILPVHLNKLITTLYNLDSSLCTIAAEGQADQELLSDIISEYRRYLQENPRYLDTLMVSDSHPSVLHLLN